MTVRTRPHRSRTRPLIGRGRRRLDVSVELVQQPAQPPAPPEARERAAGGPQDLAAYRCSCGFAFDAPVSTTVGCPHCGSTQAW